ncbi:MULTISPECIES: glycosyltransferase [Moorena]|uniref:Glycosyltransferase, MGT family n=2 Tax=Moorena TaxID=1155738 RepID=F4Y1J0_9CYAN|nr:MULTISPECIES: glycosyltransferase [Moorena]EGJ29132.1 glycosyltransferase, MGT family [Moorena producens 3L]NEP36749.1 glycosyltransferase [Moorena sp. SIO3B2]NEP69033.1 glycosyltransferase [Moorena sp. SIO3A5]OLT64114.1 glycosyl transferase family 1 [Moorena producens 3L]
MTHFGIICPAASGHLNPMTTLGYELKQRGHRVTVFGIEDAQPKALAAGLEFQLIGKSDFPKGATKDLFTQLGNLSGFKAFQYTINWIVNVAKMSLRDAPDVIKAADIELLLVDQASPAGGTIAEYLDIPFVTVCSALMFNREMSVPPFSMSWNYDPSWRGVLRNRVGYELFNIIGESLKKVINYHRKHWNLSTYNNANQYSSQLAQISQQPAELEFPRKELPSCFHFTGSYSNPASREAAPFPYEKLTGQPLIYASMGTLQNRLLWIFQMIADACVGLDAQLVIALGGGASPESLPELPGNTLVVGYAPQLELLQKATLTITHAGMNTTLESLSNGVPMVAIPITNDQPGVAARIAWTGTGEVIPLKKMSLEKLQKAIKLVLTEDSYKKNALRLQEAIIRAGGVSRAADIVEQVVHTGKPVLASTKQ